MISIKDKSKCCGCTACANVCAHGAITMHPDPLGFLYPVVNTDLCVNCGLCDKVCSFNSNYDKSSNVIQPRAFAARHKDVHHVESSRSGATFVALSDWVISKGGVIYGVGFTEHFKVVHKRAETAEQRDEFKGSKYVQSDLTGVFKQVRNDLKNGYIVMFTGTPCQTSALNSFVGKKLRERLYLIDILCHGVPSPFIWRDYIQYIEFTYSSKIVSVNFRNKQIYGWEAHRETFDFADGRKNITPDFRFYQNSPYRKSCDACPFTNTIRPSDITLADFWGWEKNVPSMNADNKGLSLIICNTEKGIELFRNVQADLLTEMVTLKNCLQPQLCEPSKQMVLRDRYERDYSIRGFKYVMNRYSVDNTYYRLENFIYRVLQKLFNYNS